MGKVPDFQVAGGRGREQEAGGRRKQVVFQGILTVAGGGVEYEYTTLILEVFDALGRVDCS